MHKKTGALSPGTKLKVCHRSFVLKREFSLRQKILGTGKIDPVTGRLQGKVHSNMPAFHPKSPGEETAMSVRCKNTGAFSCLPFFGKVSVLSALTYHSNTKTGAPFFPL
jgi:hypothetical protein